MTFEKKPVNALLHALIIAFVWCALREVPALSAEVESLYVTREVSAPPAIKFHLTRLREEIKAKGMTFTVGFTAALNRPVQQLAATRAPVDLATRIAVQHDIAGALLKLDISAREEFTSRADHPLPESLIQCSATLKKFDWRSLGGVTPVRDQKCGNCWAYASMGAYESNYLIRNNLAIDTSEQYIVCCAVDRNGIRAGTCDGGWHAGVFDYMISHGNTTELVLPDSGTDGTCPPNIATPFRAVAWDYVPTPPVAPGFADSLPAVDEMKKALCEHGPLTVAVFVTDLFQAYTGGVFKEAMPDAILTPVGPDGKKVHAINHDVTLIGWNDETNAWLIKNSWGTEWGETGGLGTEKGYMWIAYESNNVGVGAAFVVAQNIAYQPPKQILQLLPKTIPFPNLAPKTFKELSDPFRGK